MPEKPARKFTTTQREALIRAVLDEGMSQLEALRRAEHGELDGCKPFKPPTRSTLQGWLRQAMKHRKRTIQTSPEELREKLLAELWQEVELEIPGLKGSEKISRIRQAASAIDALERKTKPPKPTAQEADPAPAPGAEEAPGVEAPSLERLRKAAAQASKRTATHQPPSPQRPKGTESTSPLRSAIEQRDEQRDDQRSSNGGGGRVIAGTSAASAQPADLGLEHVSA